MLFRIIPRELVANANSQELTLYLHSGNIISLKGADDPDRLRGAGPYGIIFDEYATMKPDAWAVTEPILRANGGWAWFIGTPRGKNHLYDMYNKGKGMDDEWKSWLLKASTSGIIPQDQLAKAKLSMSDAHYNQEWECDFLEGEGQVFKNVREIMIAKPQKPKTNHTYVMGVDLAKHQDYTVISVYDRSTNAQVYQDRFNKIEWPFQKKKIKAISDHYNKALVVLDATGIGDPIYDDLSRAGVPIEPFKFTSQSKKDLIEKLAIYIEQGRIKLINTEETMLEFDNFSYEILPSGAVRYGAPTGFHDDIVIAHALAVWSLNPLYKEVIQIPKTRIQRAYAKAQTSYQRREENTDEFDEWGSWD